MSDRPYIFDGTQHDAELERLLALEGVFDAASRRMLLSTALKAGWRCLEVGAGAGSVAVWLSETVGSTGQVLAVDVNARFLKRIDISNLEVQESEIATAAVPPESMDLAHSRFVLIHVPEWKRAMTAIVACIKRGGWLVLEEPDFSCSRSIAGRPELRAAFDNVHKAIEAMFRQRGMDYSFGSRLPALLQEYGFEDISIDNDSTIVAGGSPHAAMMAMSTSQLASIYTATGLATSKDIELYSEFASDPSCWATYHATIRAVGRKP